MSVVEYLGCEKEKIVYITLIKSVSDLCVPKMNCSFIQLYI